MADEPGFIFSTTGQGAPTYEELMQRRAIAAQLIAKQRGYPKNIGEGLTALGEGFGDLIYGLRTKGDEAASRAYAAKAGAIPEAPPIVAPVTPPAAAPPPAAAAPPPAAAAPPEDVTVNQGTVFGGGSGGAEVAGDVAPAPAPPPAAAAQPPVTAGSLASAAGDRARTLIQPTNDPTDPNAGSTAGVPAPRPAGTANAGPTAPVVPSLSDPRIVDPPLPAKLPVPGATVPPTGNEVSALKAATAGHPEIVNAPPARAGADAIVPGPQSAAPVPRPGVQLASAETAPAAGNGPLDFIAARGGHASVLKDGQVVSVPPSQAGAYAPVNNEFAARLAAAGKAYEAQTGQKAKYGEMSRGNDVQSVYYNRYMAGTGGIAAAPGHSRHQKGEATDLPDSGFRDWLKAGNQDQFGLHFPVRGDPPHVQMNPKYSGPAFSSGETQVASAGPRRDAIAAVLTGNTPLTTADRAQEARVADVTGSGSITPVESFSYPPTASREDVTSDVAPSGVSALTGGSTNLGSSVADTAKARRDAITRTLSPPPASAPAPAPAPVSDATAPVTPNVQLAQKASATVSDAPPPGMQPRVPSAPPVEPIVRPTPPTPIQPDRAYSSRLDQISRDERLPPDVRKRAYDTLDDYRKQVQHQNDQLLTDYRAKEQYYREQTTPKTVYETEKARRDLEGEGFLPVPPAQVQSLMPQGGSLPPGQTVYQNRRGELKFGPTPPANTSVNIDQKQETSEAQTRGRLAAESERKLLDSAESAGSELYNIRQAQAILKRINTGVGAEANMTVSQYAKAIGLPQGVTDALGLKPDQVADKQVFQAISNKLTLGNLGSGGMPTNNFSNTDRDFVNKIVTNLGDSDQANHIKLEVMAAVKQRAMEKAEDWSNYREERIAAGKNPSFTDFEMKWNRENRQKDVLGHMYKVGEDILNSQAPAKTGSAAGPAAPQAAPQPPAAAPPVRAKGPDGKFYVPRNGQWVPE